MIEAKKMYDEGWCEGCECDAALCLSNGVCFASQNNEKEVEENGKESV